MLSEGLKNMSFLTGVCLTLPVLSVEKNRRFLLLMLYDNVKRKKGGFIWEKVDFLK